MLKGSGGRVGGYADALRAAFGPEFREGPDGTLFESPGMVRVRVPLRQDIVDQGGVFSAFKADVDARLRKACGELGLPAGDLRCEYGGRPGDDGVDMVLVASKHHSERLGDAERSGVIGLAVELKRTMDVGYR